MCYLNAECHLGCQAKTRIKWGSVALFHLWHSR
jgi:hypothetical protein